MSRLAKYMEKLGELDFESFKERNPDFAPLGYEDGQEMDEQTMIEAEETYIEEFRQHKRMYYMEKLHVEVVDDALLSQLARTYVGGLQWVLLYYFRGVPSWGWFFPCHYAPYVSDIKGFETFQPEFQLGRPFMPFEQVLFFVFKTFNEKKTMEE